MIIGILIGSIIGLFLGLIPGFNIGFAFLLALSIPDPQFACGLIIGIDSTSYIIKSLHLISEETKDICWTSIISFTTGKILGSVSGMFILMFLGESAFKLEPVHKAVALTVSLGVWISLIARAEDKVLASIGTALIALLAVLVVNLPIQQPMFVLVNCLFASSFISSLRSTKEEIKLTSYSPDKDIIQSWDGILPGMLSAILWGLPTNAVCKVEELEEDSREIITARGAIADGIASAVGLVILLSTGGVRSAAASNATLLNVSFNRLEVLGFIGISLVLSIVGYLMFEDLIPIYVKVINNTPKFINILLTLFTIGGLIYLSNGWFIVIALSCLLINKLIRQSKGPKELELIAISILPLMGIFI